MLNRKLRVRPVMGKGVQFILTPTRKGQRELRITPVADGGEVDVGGMRLEVVSMPRLGWPDTMVVYAREGKALFPGSAWSAHVCPEELVAADAARHAPARRTYYDAFLRPDGVQVREAVERLSKPDWEVEVVCPRHGPVYARDVPALFEEYRALSVAAAPGGRRRVAVLYYTIHGDTGRMAEAVAEGARAAGAEVSVLNVAEAPAAEVRRSLDEADSLAIGTPTVRSDAPREIWRALFALSAVDQRPRPGATFGSFGWGGEAPGLVAALLDAHGIEVEDRVVLVNFTPTDADLEHCREVGQALATIETGAPDVEGP
jgi:flavorubredoxin